MYSQIHGGPGSGKTEALSKRVAGLLNSGVEPEKIVLLTFTNNACDNLKSRVNDHLNDPQLSQRLSVNTFHTFCSQLISKYGKVIGLEGEWRMFDFVDFHNQKLLMLNQESLKQSRLYTFDQALELGRKIILSSNVANEFKHLFVDEFQDCDQMQFNVVKAMAHSNQQLNVTCVGDPNQEIYNFQAGHLHNAFEQMAESFPNVKVEKLVYNYRSQPQIVDYCNQIIHTGMLPVKQGVGTVQRVLYTDEVDGVYDLVKNINCDLSEVGVLMRTNAEVFDLSQKLKLRGVKVNNAFGLKALGVKELPNLGITLLKYSLYNSNAHLLQLLYSRYHKMIKPQHLPEIMGAENMVSAVQKHISLDKLLDAQNKLINSMSVSECLMNLNDIVLNFRPREPTPIQTHFWSTFLGMLDIPSGETVPGEALNTTLKQIYAKEKDEVQRGRLNILTMHGAKSKQWPVVIASLKHLPFKKNEDEERRLMYVTSSRAQNQLYFLNGGTSTQNLLKAPVKDELNLQRVKTMSYKEAVKRDPLVFGKLVAKRVANYVLKI